MALPELISEGDQMDSFPLDISSLQFIEAALAGNVDAAELREYLAEIKTALLDPLKHKERDTQARQAVKSGKIATKTGVRTLDPEPDIQQIILLSDELNLNEIECVDLIEEALRKTGKVSAAAAAGEFYGKRAAAVHCLMTLLITQVSGYGSIGDEIFGVVEDFNVGMLKEKRDGSGLLVKNICRRIQESTSAMKDVLHSKLMYIENSMYGSRAECMYKESLQLCECLVYACCINQRMAPSDIGALLDLLNDLMQHDAAHSIVSMHQHASFIVIAIMLTLLPQEVENQEMKEDDIVRLQSTLEDQGLKTKLNQFVTSYNKSNSPFVAIVQMVESMMGLYFEKHDQEASKGAIQALSRGVFGHMKQLLFDECQLDEVMEFTVASTVYQFVLLSIDVSEGISEESKSPVSWLVKSSKDRAVASRRARPGDGETDAIFPADDLASLLHLWASCLEGRFSLVEASQEYIAKFLRAVGTDEHLMLIPSVFIGHMAILSALASTQQGACTVFHSLHDKNTSPFVAWQKLFSTLKSMIQIYGNAARSEVQQPVSSLVLPEDETNGLCAFVNVFRQVMTHGPAEEVLSWLQALEEEAGMSPSWDILFEAMCCPVPQKLKAALDKAIASLAGHQVLVVPLWERLLGAVVVRKDSLQRDGRKHVPVKYDLSYQLNEIEARAEEYEEAIAFVELLNALWENSKAFVDGGAKYGHFTRFVLEEIVSSIYQRSFKFEKERWQLMSQCLLHCRLCLESLPAATSQEEEAMTPGEYVLTDLLENRNLFRVVNFTLCLGTDWLSDQSREGSLAEYKTETVTEALRLVQCAMGVDQDFIETKQNNILGRTYSPLETVLLHDRERIPKILDYCRFSWDSKLRKEALLVSQSLIQRIPNIVSKLESSPPPEGVSIKNNLQSGYSTILRSANSTPEASQQGVEDDCAQLALDIILDSLKSGVPSNFGQYICGFEVCAGMDYMSLENPSFSSSPLKDILDILLCSTASSSRPQLYEKCLQVVFYLSETPETSQYFVHYLFSSQNGLVSLIPSILFTPLPVQRASQVSSMYHRAWLLQILATEIFVADTEFLSTKESVMDLIKSLFRVRGDIGMVAAKNQMFSSLADTVWDILASMPREPWLGDGLSAPARKMLDLLDVESLLHPKVLEQGEGAALVNTWRGDVVIDIPALKDQVLQRYFIAIASHGDLVESLKEAGRHALNQAANLNHFAEYTGGLCSLMSGCQAVILSVVSKKYENVVEACGSSHMIAQYLAMAIQDCTNVIASALECACPRAAHSLGISLEAMVSRLHDVSSSSPQVLNLVSTTLLGKQMEIIWNSRQHESLRMSMYNTLAIYLDLSRNSKALSPDMKEASINTLYQHMRSLQPIISDSISSTTSVATNGLMALSALLSYDPTTGVAAAIHSSPLPSKVLHDLKMADPKHLSSSLPSSRATALLHQARVDFLLNLTLAGQGQARCASVQKMVSHQTIKVFIACRLFDMIPEKSGAAASLVQGVGVTRGYLHQFISPSLRVILSIISTLGESEGVLAQAHEFMTSHPQLVDRILKECGCSSAAIGWEIGTKELEEANLVVQICTILAISGAKYPHLMLNFALHEGLLDLSSRMFLLNSQSHSPIICGIQDYMSSEEGDAGAERAHKALMELRSSLAMYIRIWLAQVQEKAPFPPPTGKGSVEVTSILFSLKDALYQSAMYDLPRALDQLHASKDAILLKKQVSVLIRLMEHVLASMYIAMSGSPSSSISSGDLDKLRRLCGPAIANLEQLIEKEQIPGDAESFAVLLRKTKAQLYGFNQ